MRIQQKENVLESKQVRDEELIRKCKYKSSELGWHDGCEAAVLKAHRKAALMVQHLAGLIAFKLADMIAALKAHYKAAQMAQYMTDLMVDTMAAE